ncbi:hypothetical protein AHAS_AhasUnG0031300 [Arachis hypogaea]
MFTDNLLLFAETTQEQMHQINYIMDIFYKAPGLKINSNKTSIVFSKGTTTTIGKEIRSIAGFREERELGKYLGAIVKNSKSKRRSLRMSWKESVANSRGGRGSASL